MSNTTKLRVFLCHASEDKSRVRSLYKKLTSECWIDGWLDEEKLLPGQKWKIEIPQAVRAAHVVIVCLSTKSVSKEGYVQKELRYALDTALEKPEETIFIIPLRLDDCKVPESIKEFHWINLFSDADETAYERLKKSLMIRAISLGINSEAVSNSAYGQAPTEYQKPSQADAPVEKSDPKKDENRLPPTSGKAGYARIDTDEVNSFGFPLYRVGNVFLDGWEDVAHIVALVDSDPLPTDEDAPSYRAICGKWGYSYGMGDTTRIANFIARSPQETPQGIVRCPICFAQNPLQVKNN